MILKASEDYGTPRNIYGVTKKLAEDYCKEATCNVAILRCSRFFAEDPNFFRLQTPHKLETWSFERFRASESDIYLVEFVTGVRNLQQCSNSIQLELTV